MLYNNAEFYNVQEMMKPEEGEGILLSRVPAHVRCKLNEVAQKMAFNGCGCEIRFNMQGDKVKIILGREYLPDIVDKGIMEVYYGDFHAPFQISPNFIGFEPTEIIITKPDNMESLKKIAQSCSMGFDPELIRIILPYDAPNRFYGLEGNIEPVRSGQTPEMKYLCYGSSITHGGSSVSPMGTYTRKIAYMLGVDLISLGFAGSARIEPEMAEYIAGRTDWDFASLELGINVLGLFSVEEFRKRIDYFISCIAEANQDKWIFCTDIFTCDADIFGDVKVNEFREAVKKKVESMKMPKLVYVPGKDMLTSAMGLSADLVHPSPKGMEEIGYKLSDIMKKNMHHV